MANRYDILSPRTGNDGKTRWQKIGVAFPKDGDRFSILLEALPLPDREGRVSLLMSEPREKRQESAPAGNAFDDEIPL